MRSFVLLTAVALASVAGAAASEEAAQNPSIGLTLEGAIAYADAHYPAVRLALEEKTAAEKNVNVARAAFFPQVNLLWQINRATINNTTGSLFPQAVVPSITGAVMPQSGRMAWDDAAGVLVDWNAVDFGVRAARVAAARETSEAAHQSYELTRIDVVDATANAYLNLAAAQALAQAAQANVDRLHAFNAAVHVLVANKLRPGVDGEQADAAESLGRTQLSTAIGNVEIQRATLAKLVGKPPEQLALADPTLKTDAPMTAPPAAEGPLQNHPAAQAEAARVRAQQAQLKAIDRSYAPHLDVLAGASARESGKTPGGLYEEGAQGLGLETGNWGVGMQVTLPLGSYPALHAQRQSQRATVSAEQAQYDQTLRDLDEQLRQARANLTTAQSIAKLTPVALTAAHNAEEQQRVRYKTGLATVVDVTAAEAALAQAESQDAVARLNVWRAWANYAAATGDLSPFRSMISRQQ